MAHPKRQHSKQRTRKGRTHKSLKPNLGSLSLEGNPSGYNHGVDPFTGMYKGRQIVDVSKKTKNEEPQS